MMIALDSINVGDRFIWIAIDGPVVGMDDYVVVAKERSAIRVRMIRQTSYGILSSWCDQQPFYYNVTPTDYALWFAPSLIATPERIQLVDEQLTEWLLSK